MSYNSETPETLKLCQHFKTPKAIETPVTLETLKLAQNFQTSYETLKLLILLTP